MIVKQLEINHCSLLFPLSVI